VHSEAQLSNSLTKGGTKELELYYTLNYRWRLVSDEHMRSSRKRKQQGLEALEQQQQHTSKETKNNSVE
jgi:hypothetical protein